MTHSGACNSGSQPPFLHPIKTNEIYSECFICFLNISETIIQAPFLMLSREYQNDQYGKWIKYTKVWELVITAWVNNSLIRFYSWIYSYICDPLNDSEYHLHDLMTSAREVGKGANICLRGRFMQCLSLVKQV